MTTKHKIIAGAAVAVALIAWKYFADARQLQDLHKLDKDFGLSGGWDD